MRSRCADLGSHAAALRLYLLRGDLGLTALFRHPLPQITEMLMQLIERKAEREKMLELIARHAARQAFLADRADLGHISLECRLGGCEGRRDAARDQRRRAVAQI